jgi:hypothetical protein
MLIRYYSNFKKGKMIYNVSGALVKLIKLIVEYDI